MQLRLRMSAMQIQYVFLQQTAEGYWKTAENEQEQQVGSGCSDMLASMTKVPLTSTSPFCRSLSASLAASGVTGEVVYCWFDLCAKRQLLPSCSEPVAGRGRWWRDHTSFPATQQR